MNFFPGGAKHRAQKQANSPFEFKSQLQSARESPQMLGTLLDEFRASLNKVATAGLSGDIQAKIGASDLVQQSMLEAIQGFAEFRGQTRPELNRWLQQILIRNLLNELRKWRNTKMRANFREISIDQPDANDLPGRERTPSSIVSARETESLLHEALNHLSPEYQLVLRLRHFERLGFDEIAKRMNRKYSATRMLWYRAFEKLIHQIGGLRREPG